MHFDISWFIYSRVTKKTQDQKDFSLHFLFARVHWMAPLTEIPFRFERNSFVPMIHQFLIIIVKLYSRLGKKESRIDHNNFSLLYVVSRFPSRIISRSLLIFERRISIPLNEHHRDRQTGIKLVGEAVMLERKPWATVLTVLEAIISTKKSKVFNVD